MSATRLVVSPQRLLKQQVVVCAAEGDPGDSSNNPAESWLDGEQIWEDTTAVNKSSSASQTASAIVSSAQEKSSGVSYDAVLELEKVKTPSRAFSTDKKAVHCC